MAWMSEYKLHESRRGLELKFFHNVFSVGLNGIYTEVQVIGNLLIGMLPADEQEDLLLPPGKVKLLQKCIVRFKILNGQVRAEWKTGLPRMHQVNSMIQVFCIAVFKQVAPGAGIYGLVNQVGIIVAAHNNHFYPGIAIPDQAGGI